MRFLLFTALIISLLEPACQPAVKQTTASKKPETPPKFVMLYRQSHEWMGDKTVVQGFEIWEGPQLCLMVVDLAGDGGDSTTHLSIAACEAYK